MDRKRQYCAVLWSEAEHRENRGGGWDADVVKRRGPAGRPSIRDRVPRIKAMYVDPSGRGKSPNRGKKGPSIKASESMDESVGTPGRERGKDNGARYSPPGGGGGPTTQSLRTESGRAGTKAVYGPKSRDPK